ncbi:adenylyl-sulfate kinase [Pseudomonas sp. TTU2014-080ASC]|uniref:adenylyl-sulfate kinase n=1 Tax=Pseudomonas sp. TTU2014-080ASC TaxID=1729724 RepID=UPI000718A0FA|nr:adenylyl-sulfate kinase [Pseudomonas sp. TTU2014-080ASC]KRW59093.1 adenylylsulfate kinase [Pseudomonas sp. TTU2014-080ASC]
MTSQEITVSPEQRAALKQQRPRVIWLTGLSGAGKSTIANALEAALHTQQNHTCLLDGDRLRSGLCSDLGFSDKDRKENIRRVAEVARLLIDSGLIVITALISPFREDRDRARKIIGPENFLEVFIDTPLQECERRDPKGLYRKVRSGELLNFTGISSPYEAPVNPDIHIETLSSSVSSAVEQILQALG